MKPTRTHLTFLAILTICYTACSQSPEAQISGKWMMDSVIQDGRNVSIRHNPRNERYITFREDGTFESGGYPYEINTGVFVIQDDTLLLDSDAGPEDDSQWIMAIEGSVMTWIGVGSEWAERFRMKHVRPPDKQ